MRSQCYVVFLEVHASLASGSASGRENPGINRQQMGLDQFHHPYETARDVIE
jgi:hypothetical protein